MILFVFTSSTGKLGERIPLEKAPGGILLITYCCWQKQDQQSQSLNPCLSASGDLLGKVVVGKPVCMKTHVEENSCCLECWKCFFMLRIIVSPSATSMCFLDTSRPVLGHWELKISSIKWPYSWNMGRRRMPNLDTYGWWKGQLSFSGLKRDVCGSAARDGQPWTFQL